MALDHPQRCGHAPRRERRPEHVHRADEEQVAIREACVEPAAARIDAHRVLDEAGRRERGHRGADDEQQRFGVAQHHHAQRQNVPRQKCLGAGHVARKGAVAVEPREAEGLPQTVVVTGEPLGHRHTPDVVHARVETITPAGIVEGARYEQRRGPFIAATGIERGAHVVAQLVVVEAETGDDEPRVEARQRSAVLRTERAEGVAREVEAQQIAHQQKDRGDREHDR